MHVTLHRPPPEILTLVKTSFYRVREWQFPVFSTMFMAVKILLHLRQLYYIVF
jgi:hypothetical protein